MKQTALLLLFLLLALAAALGVRRMRAAEPGGVSLPKIVSFTATPNIARPGESVTVAWQTRGAQSMALAWGPAVHAWEDMKRQTGLPPSGTLTDHPRETTIYVLECEDKLGTVCTSASVTVTVK